MAKQVREKLRPLYGKRVRVRGILSNFRAWQQNYREVGAACISQPEIDCEVVADHVWVLHVPHWQCHRDDVGRQVSAVVGAQLRPQRHGSLLVGVGERGQGPGLRFVGRRATNW